MGYFRIIQLRRRRTCYVDYATIYVYLLIATIFMQRIMQRKTRTGSGYARSSLCIRSVQWDYSRLAVAVFYPGRICFYTYHIAAIYNFTIGITYSIYEGGSNSIKQRAAAAKSVYMYGCYTKTN